MRINNYHKKIISEIALECINNRVTLLLSNQTGIKFIDEPDTSRSRGFFDEESLILAVGTKNPAKIWFPILLHEYNHMRQWIEGEFSDYEFCDASEKFYLWLDKEIDLSKSEVNKMIEIIRECEIDCEKRTLKMMQDNLGIYDPKKYAKHANSYLLFYSIIKDVQRWYKKPPYAIRDILKIMPNELLNNFNKVPKEYRNLVFQKCF